MLLDTKTNSGGGRITNGSWREMPSKQAHRKQLAQVWPRLTFKRAGPLSPHGAQELGIGLEADFVIVRCSRPT
jgi:hypothetical protein